MTVRDDISASRRLTQLDPNEEGIADAILSGMALDTLRKRADKIIAARAQLQAELADATAALDAVMIHLRMPEN